MSISEWGAYLYFDIFEWLIIYSRIVSVPLYAMYQMINYRISTIYFL